jgi:aspartyl-tRNA(Asn)/glutamyl-tRNA(Gln) amidotransferase subunit A
MSGPFNEMTSAYALGALFDQGTADPREVAEFYLERAEAHDTDHRIFTYLQPERARAEADAASDRMRRGLRRHPLDGVPLSWKDLFDVKGLPSTAGSLMLQDRIAADDAEVLARATRLGSICLGKTTMTELAFSGLGINPSFGTPANPFDEHIERIPGGSSSGAAVSLSRGLACGAVGTDTGGSVRIPSGWNGLVGLKTTAGLLPLKGTVPLSPSFDTVGPLARDVTDASLLLSLLLERKPFELDGVDLKNVSLLLPGGIAWRDLDTGIGEALHAATLRLTQAGARIIERPVPEMDEIDQMAWDGRSSRLAAEAYELWGAMIAAAGDKVYAPVSSRIQAGGLLKPEDIAAGDVKREELRRRYIDATSGIDAVLMPTVAITPPPIARLEPGGPDYFAANRMALRNATIANQLGLCAITLPIGYDTMGMPVGLMLQAAPFQETRLLALALSIEKALH